MLFKVFYKSVVLITLIGLVVLCLKGEDLGRFKIFIEKDIRLSGSKSKKWYWVFIPVLLFLLYILFRPLYPPGGWDDISYHLAYAKYYVANNGLVLNPYLRYALHPHNMNILYSMALLFYDDILAQSIHASMAIVAAVGIYSLGSIIFNRIAALTAAMIFLCSPLVLHLMQVAYIDLGLMLFIFCTYYCFSLWLTTQERFWLYLAGASLGWAVGTKYLGLLFLLLFLIWMIKKERKTRVILVFSLIVVVAGSPWYVRNHLIAKDPLFPFGGKIFGYSWLWNEHDAAGQANDLYVEHGTPRTIKSFLTLPRNLVVQKHKFMEGAISLPMLVFFLAFLFFLWGNKHFKRMTIFSYVNLLIWFMTTQILRYFLPVFPFVSLISGAILVMFISFVLRQASKPFHNHMLEIVRNPDRWSSWAKGTILLILLLIVGLYIKGDDFSVKAIPTTRQAREKYLLNKMPGYKFVQIINGRQLTAIYSIGYEDMQYFVEGKMVGDWFGPMRHSAFYPILKDSDKLYEKLNRLGIKYFLINKRRVGQGEIDTRRHFQILYENEDGILFKLDH
jgi:hypothetical protein